MCSQASSHGRVPWSRVLSGLLRAVPPAVLALMLATLLIRVSCGFDITDESYGLLWADQPDRILGWTYQFGYLTGWLYGLSGHQIAFFRVLGILILLATGCLFSSSLLRCGESRLPPDSRRNGAVSWHALVLAGTLGFYQWWMLTPSYNWLVLVGLLVCASGLLRSVSPPASAAGHVRIVAEGLLTGGGLFLVGMAKPPAAVLLLPVILLWPAVHPHQKRKILFLGTVFFWAGLLVVLQALLTKGGLPAWIAGMREGLHQEALLGGGHTMEEVLSKTWIQWVGLIRQVFRLLWGWGSGILLAAGGICSIERWGREKWSAAVLSGVWLLLPVWILLRLLAGGCLVRSQMGLSGLVLLSGFMILGILAKLAGCSGNRHSCPAGWGSLLMICLWLFLLSGIYAAGTNNPLSLQLAGAGVFFVAGAGLVARWIGCATGRGWMGAWVSALLSLALLMPAREALKNPYRLPAGISEQVVPVRMLGRGGRLQVDPDTAGYINGLKQIATRAGWSCGTPLIDLTGASPGASVILDAEILATPWLIGGYGGSEAYARRVLELTPPAGLRGAWVLTAPEGRRAISSGVLSCLGFPDDYVSIGSVQTGCRAERQLLWKPETGSFPKSPDQGSD